MKMKIATERSTEVKSWKLSVFVQGNAERLVGLCRITEKKLARTETRGRCIIGL